MKKIVFLVSGNGGTLKFMENAIELLGLNFKIVGVVADRDCGAVKFAQKKNLYNKIIKYTQNHTFELNSELSFLNPDIIITNIHKIIDVNTLNCWHGKFINVHYSLLPSFGGVIGMETVSAAREQNVRFIGATVHEVSEVVDAGQIIQQACFCVDWKNVDTIYDTIFRIASLSLLGSLYGDLTSTHNFFRINNFVVQFSPELAFPVEKFTEEFWNTIK